MKPIAVAAVALVLAVPGAAATTPTHAQHVLTAFAGIGTVYWRGDCSPHQPARWSIGVRITGGFDVVATRWAGSAKTHRTLQPGRPAVWFPYRGEHEQILDLAQGDEAWVMDGHVKARFTGCDRWIPDRK